MPFLTFFANSVVQRLGLALGLAALVGWGVMAIRAGGVAACERDHQAAALQATQALHAQYVAEKERGDKISADLIKVQQENQHLRSQHANDARLITGFCPNGLRVFHDYAARGEALPEAARTTLGAPGTVAASDIAQALAINYSRARDCQSQLNALIDWAEGYKNGH